MGFSFTEFILSDSCVPRPSPRRAPPFYYTFYYIDYFGRRPIATEEPIEALLAKSLLFVLANRYGEGSSFPPHPPKLAL